MKEYDMPSPHSFEVKYGSNSFHCSGVNAAPPLCNWLTVIFREKIGNVKQEKIQDREVFHSRL